MYGNEEVLQHVLEEYRLLFLRIDGRRCTNDSGQHLPLRQGLTLSHVCACNKQVHNCCKRDRVRGLLEHGAQLNEAVGNVLKDSAQFGGNSRGNLNGDFLNAR